MGFTGSPEVGAEGGGACGENLVPVKLELGGKGAAVVFDDVDVEDVADKLVEAVTFNTGQVCCTATRWLLHERIYDAFVEAAGRAHAGRCGSATNGARLRPWAGISEKQRQRILSYLAARAARGRAGDPGRGQVRGAGCEGGLLRETGPAGGQSRQRLCPRGDLRPGWLPAKVPQRGARRSNW